MPKFEFYENFTSKVVATVHSFSNAGVSDEPGTVEDLCKTHSQPVSLLPMLTAPLCMDFLYPWLHICRFKLTTDCIVLQCLLLKNCA